MAGLVSRWLGGAVYMVCELCAITQWKRNYLAETCSDGKKLQNR